ncbi:MAG: hypothetical protein DRP94_01660 [Candidatus Latescibacterota bacterium]|nr:MAG: hypothetical protein DRP94_01660 [Candidatus Latescibacterota bacterium]
MVRFLLALCSLAWPAHGQVEVELTVEKYPSAYLSDWETRTDIVSLELRNVGDSPVTVKLSARITGRRHGEVASGWSLPITLEAGEIRTVWSDELVDWGSVSYEESLRDQIISTGRLPEDEYTICVIAYRVLDGWVDEEHPLGQDSERFYIIAFSPPSLVSPEDGQVLSSRDFPLEWESATDAPNFEVHYHLRMYEVLDGQTPQEAAEANRPFYERELVSQVCLVYPPDAPDLVPGQQYAWYVQATDSDGDPLGENEGKSEVRSFWYMFGGGSEVLEGIERLVLVEGMAYLEGLSGLSVRSEGGRYFLNGDATLVLEGLPGSPALTATLQDLEVDLSDVSNPRIFGGTVTASISAEEIGLDLGGLPVDLTDLTFSTYSGLTVGVRLNLEGFEEVVFEGRLELTSRGLSGTVEARAPPGEVLGTVGEPPLQFQFTELSLHFSDPTLTASGNLSLFGRTLPCAVSDLSWSEGRLSGTIDCSPDTSLPLVPGSDLLTLHIGRLVGAFSFDLSGGPPSYDVTVEGEVDFKLGGHTCGASVRLSLSPGSLDVEEFRPTCDFSEHPIDLGWLRMTIRNLSLSKLSFSDDGWDFGFGMDLVLDFPSLPDLDLPALSGVTLDEEGFHLPAVSLDTLDLPPVNIGGIGVALRSFSMPELVFPWFGDWEGFDWGIRVSFVLSLPELPSAFPDCLRNLNVLVEDASFGPDGVSGEIEPVSLSGCRMNLGGGMGFVVDEVSGSFGAGSSLSLSGRLELPESLRCEGYTGPEAELSLSPSGEVSGRIEGIVPPCPLRFGPFSFVITSATLTLGPGAVLRMEGRLEAPGAEEGTTVAASGVLEYDILNNRLVDGSLSLEEPFRLDFPQDSPLLSFRINRAVLDTSGLHVDGSHNLRVGEQNIPVSFHDFTFDPFELSIAGGSATFSERFSVKVVLEDGNLRWQSVPFKSSFEDSLGLRLDLAGDISLDPTGLHISGEGEAFLRYEGRDLDSLSASFQDFAISFRPLGVSSGKVSFRYGGQLVGELGPEGFMPNLAFFGRPVIPERLPLPSEEIAYVVLKENDELLLDMEVEDSNLHLHTRPGRPLRLVLLALQLGASEPPEVDVSFDVVVDPIHFSLVSGDISVEDVRLDLTGAGLPFVLTGLTYSGGQFSFEGKVSLFGEEASGLELSLGGDGHLRGSVRVPLERDFVIAEDLVSVRVDSVTGDVDADLLGVPSFELTASGSLNISLGEGRRCASPLVLAISNSGFEVRDFSLECDSLYIDFEWVGMEVKRLAFSELSWSREGGWDFGFSMDLCLAFPDWGISLPEIRDIGWDGEGFHFPEVNFPDLEGRVEAFELMGFRIQPLAFRMNPVTVPWPDWRGTDWGFRFDLDVSFPELPSGFPACLRNPELTIRDASYQDGMLTATIETKVIEEPGCPIPLGGATLYVTELGGGFSVRDGHQEGHVDLRARLQLPESLGCGDTLSLGETRLRITGDGLVTGTVENILPPCPLNFGPFSFRVTSSTLELGSEEGRQTAILDLRGNLRLPAPTEGDTVEVEGWLRYDLINNDLIDGRVAINKPFRWDLPEDEPVFSFVVQNGELTPRGLTLSGGGSLALGEGATVGVTFDSLGLSFPDLIPISGGVDFSANFALKVGFGAGGLTWAAVDTSVGLEEDGVLLTLPTVSIRDGKLLASGERNVKIKYQGRDFLQVRAVFSDFTMGFSPVGLDSGKVDFYIDTLHVAVLNKDGFLPLEGLLQLVAFHLPDRIPLPDTTIAYLELKDERGNLRVTAEQVPGGYRIGTREGGVPLVVPALAYGGDIPRWDVSFDVVFNPSDWSLVSGNIGVSAPEGESLLDLTSRGIPIKIKALDYAEVGGHYSIILSASLSLPEALGGASLVLDSLEVTSSGISGTASLRPAEGQSYAEEVSIGDILTVHFREVEATFGSFSCQLSGDITSPAFSDTAMPFNASLSVSDGMPDMQVELDLSALGAIPMGVAEFQPQPIGDSPAFSITVGEDFELVLSGIFRVPSLSPDFRLTIEGLTLNSSGLSVRGVQPTPQSFELFSSTFGIDNMGFSYEDGVFYVTMSGTLEFMDQRIDFSGLKVGSDGSFSIEGAFLDREIVVLDPYLRLTRIGLEGDSLSVQGKVQLPEPFDTAPQDFAFKIGRGGVTGEVTVKALDERTELGRGDETELSFGGVGTLDLTYLALGLDFGDISRSHIDAVMDFYIEDEQSKRIGIGSKSGGTVTPGVSITFEPDVNWGPVTLPESIGFSYKAFSLVLTGISIPEGPSFGLTFSGSLEVGLSGVGGSLSFEGWGFSRDGVEVGTIQGGTLKITKLLTITVNNISYSDEPITLSITQATWGSSNAPPDTSSQTVTADWHFSFGASLTLMDFGGGGIDRFLIFGQDDNLSLIIENAHLDVKDVLSVSLDFQYITTSEGWKLAFAGHGDFKAVEVGAAGKIAYMRGEASFGLFVLVEGAVRVPVGPGVFMTGFGGGFFYNPDPADIQVVKNLCGFGSEKVEDTGKFAAFLYGTVAFVDDYFVEGAALVTISQNYFSLDASVVLLSMRGHFEGNLGLTIGFTSAYVTGEINVTLDIYDLLRGGANIEAFYYGTDAWAVTGHFDVSVLSFFEAESDLFIGSPGFMVSMKVEKSFDILIVEVSAGFEGMVWYMDKYIEAGSQDLTSWGGYFKAWVEVEVLGGVAGAEGWLECALVYASSFKIYGLAGLEVHVLFFSWEGSVWAKISSGGDVDAGFGRDPEMDRLIDEAKGMAEEMKEAKQAVEQAINEAKQAALALTPEQRARAGVYWITEATGQEKYAPLEDEREAGVIHIFGYEEVGVSDIPVLEGVIENALDDLPGKSGRESTIHENFVFMQSMVERLQNTLDEVSQRLEGIEIEVPDIDTGQEYEIGASPVTLVNIAPSGADTLTEEEVRSLGFDVDEGTVENQKSTVSQAEEEYENLDERIRQQIDEIWDQLDDVGRDLEYCTGRIGWEYKFALDGMYDYYTSYLDYLRDLYWHYYDNLQYLRDNEDRIRFAQLPPSPWIAILDSTKIRQLTLRRKWWEFYMLYSANLDSVNIRYQDAEGVINTMNRNELVQACLNAGIELWYQIPYDGNQKLMNDARALRDSLAVEFNEKLEAINTAMENLETKVDRLYQAKADLVETLYDLYDRLRYRNQRVVEAANLRLSTISAVQMSPLMAEASMHAGVLEAVHAERGPSSPMLTTTIQVRTDALQRIERTMEQAEKMLHVPRVTQIHVSTYQGPSCAYFEASFDASHPDHITEFSYQLRPQGWPPAPDKWICLGTRKSLRMLFIPELFPVTGYRNTLYIRARGPAGYTNVRSADFSFDVPGWPRSEPAGPVGSSEMSGDTTPPSTPVVSTAPYISSHTQITASWEARDDESGVVEYYYRVYRYTRSTPFFFQLYGEAFSRISSIWQQVGGSSGTVGPGTTLQQGGMRIINYAAVPFGAGTTAGTIRTWTSSTGPQTQTIFQAGTMVVEGTLIPFEPPEWEPITDWLPAWGRKDSVTIRGLELEHDRLYRVGVKAVNGEGLESEEGYSDPILVDHTPPEPPELEEPEDFATAVASLTAVVEREGLVPGVRIRWRPALEPESGISEYLVAVTREPLSSWSPDLFRSAGTALEYRYMGEPLVFVDTCYVNLVALNKAGLMSDIVTVPVVVHDPTPPSPPSVSVEDYVPRTDKLYINFDAWAEDPESGVAGYQVAIGTTPGGTDVKPWPEGIDFACAPEGGMEMRLLAPQAIGLGAEVVGMAPTLGVPVRLLSGLSLEHGGTYYLSVRAVNRDGDVGHPAVAGPFVVDTSPPPLPSLSARYSPAGELIMEFKGLEDPESGIAEVRLDLGTSPGTDDVLSDHVVSLSPAKNLTWEHPISLERGRNYYLEVTYINGAGLRTSYADSFRAPDITPPRVLLGADVQHNPLPRYLRPGDFRAHVRATDPETGVEGLWMFLGTSPKLPDSPDWRSLDPMRIGWIIIPEHMLSHGKTYYLFVRAVNGEGLETVESVGPVTVISERPDAPRKVTLTQVGHNRLRIEWTCVEPSSTVKRYEYALGTSKGGKQVRDWTSLDARPCYKEVSVGLVPGKTYYASVRAVDYLDQTGPAGESEGVVAEYMDPTPPTISWLRVEATMLKGTPRIRASWYVSDPESGIEKVEVQLSSYDGGKWSVVSSRRKVPRGRSSFVWMKRIEPEWTQVKVDLWATNGDGDVAHRTAVLRLR